MLKIQKKVQKQRSNFNIFCFKLIASINDLYIISIYKDCSNIVKVIFFNKKLHFEDYFIMI
jgi:hypothetical protein